jgi:thiamine-monophosphate kinase
LVANLSDLAAMGAQPRGFTVALAAPPGLEVRALDGLLGGLLDEAEAHGCPLVGGNLSRARQTTITITAQGTVKRGRALLRNAARPGDRIFVTGTLGVSALERARARAGRGRIAWVPTPRLQAGLALARGSGVGACIDISDGLLADLDHVLTRSGCSAEIDQAAVPRPARFDSACRRLGVDPIELAVCGGEDYELLFTVRRTGPSGAQLRRRLGVAVTEIGRVIAGCSRKQKSAGWRHF